MVNHLSELYINLLQVLCNNMNKDVAKIATKVDKAFSTLYSGDVEHDSDNNTDLGEIKNDLDDFKVASQVNTVPTPNKKR